MPNNVILTPDTFIEFVRWMGYDVDTEPGNLNLLCIQGISPVGGTPTKIGTNDLALNDNAPDKQNDTVALLTSDANGKLSVTSLVGTMEPGKYYTKDDPNPAGAAHLTFGQHLYTKGFHNQQKYGTSQPCLRSLNEINRIWRDKNGNFKPDVGESVVEAACGTNVHAGSKTDYIGQYSAGCVNIGGGIEGVPYQTFIKAIEADVVADAKQGLTKNVVRVNIWRGVDILHFREAGYMPTLVMGMKGAWVAKMQAALKAKGYAVTPDGDWRDKTTEAVVAFQKKAGLGADGWVGPKSWAALLS